MRPNAQIMSSTLSTHELTKTYGGRTVVRGVSLDVNSGEVVGLLGPNGAGKTTTFDLIAGLQTCDSGDIIFDGQSLRGLPSFKVFHQGLARTFQVPRPFAQMTVLENLLIAPINQLGENFQANWWAFSRVRAQERALHERARSVLELCALAD